MKMTAALVTLIATAMTFASSANGVSLGQSDDFQNGALASWANGGAGGVPPLVNVSTGGPNGAGDRFLQITADGAGAGSRLTAFNRGQWLGDYLGAGITAFEVDLLNLGTIQLSIRLAFKSSLSSGAPAYLTLPAILPVGSGWQHVTFSISLSDLIPVAGPPAYNTLFSSGIAEVRFINEVGANNSNGDIVTAQVGVDNIRAVPEPQVSLLLAIGAVAVLVRRQARAPR